MSNMDKRATALSNLKFHPATPSRWSDIETLFGERGAKIVEGYPTEPTMEHTPDPFIWTGTPSAFRKAGFREVLRRSKARPIMRFNYVGSIPGWIGKCCHGNDEMKVYSQLCTIVDEWIEI